MITILRRLLGVVLILAGLAALVFGGWFARALGTSGEATFVTNPPAGLPVVIDAQTNARTDIPLVITATADDDVPITVSIAGPSDATALLAETRYVRVSGIEVRDWLINTQSIGTDDPITPATADLWRSQETSTGSLDIAGDLESAPETMIITTPEGESLDQLTMTWTNPAWFYQALSVVFAGLLTALVGLALVVRKAATTEPETTEPEATEPETTEPATKDPETAA